MISRGFLYILLTIFLNSNDAFSICSEKVNYILTEQGLGKVAPKLGLTENYEKKLLKLLEVSESRRAGLDLIRELEISIFLKFGNILKRRSRDIYLSFVTLEKYGFKKSNFVKKMLQGEELTIDEKRAYYLLANKRFWFEDGFFKYRFYSRLKKISVVSFVEKKIYDVFRLGPRDFLEKFYFSVSQRNVLYNLFKRGFVDQEIAEAILRSDSSGEIQRLLENELNHIMIDLKLENSLIKKSYLQFKADKFTLYLSILKNVEMESVQLKNSFLFRSLPNSLRKIEDFNRAVWIVVISTVAIEEALTNYFEFKEVTIREIEEVADLSKIPKSSDDVKELSVEEMAEELFNSGKITFEEYLQRTQ